MLNEMNGGMMFWVILMERARKGTLDLSFPEELLGNCVNFGSTSLFGHNSFGRWDVIAKLALEHFLYIGCH
jgi:hypothetical protein